VLLPLTLISGIFGMNVKFPGYGSAEAFWVVAGVMAGTILSMVAFFRWKRWL
jgi:Mg2+ and Co2+ transporter CorA